MRRHLDDDDPTRFDDPEELVEVGPRQVGRDVLEGDVAEHQGDRTGFDAVEPGRFVELVTDAGSVPVDPAGHGHHGGRDVQTQYLVEVVPEGLGETPHPAAEVQRLLSVGKSAAEFPTPPERCRDVLPSRGQKRIQIPLPAQSIRLTENRPQGIGLGLGVPYGLDPLELIVPGCDPHGGCVVRRGAVHGR